MISLILENIRNLFFIEISRNISEKILCDFILNKVKPLQKYIKKSKESNIQLNGKLFEYLRANRPIVAIGPEFSDIKPIISQTSTGEYFNYLEYEKLKSHILFLFSLYNEKSLKITANNIENYSRYNCTKQLSEILN